jgi:alkylhydroperoxidase/carboxymuconolactone decarboxylase family protein YurZ
VEEVLHLGATDAEVAETLDIALYMGGSLALKSVRYAFQVREELRGRRAE